MFTGFIMNVFVFFLLNWAFSSCASLGNTHVFGKKSYSSRKTLFSRIKFRARLFLRLSDWMPGELFIRW